MSSPSQHPECPSHCYDHINENTPIVVESICGLDVLSKLFIFFFMIYLVNKYLPLFLGHGQLRVKQHLPASPGQPYKLNEDSKEARERKRVYEDIVKLADWLYVGLAPVGKKGASPKKGTQQKEAQQKAAQEHKKMHGELLRLAKLLYEGRNDEVDVEENQELGLGLGGSPRGATQ